MMQNLNSGQFYLKSKGSHSTENQHDTAYRSPLLVFTQLYMYYIFCSYSVVYNIIFEGQLLYWHLVAIYVVVAYSSVYLKKKSLLDHTCSFKLHRDL